MNATSPNPASEATEVTGLPYAELRKRSDKYLEEDWQTIEDLYEGGFQLRRAAARYLPRLTNEHAERHQDRVRSTAYLNYFAQIVDYFTAALFTQEITVREAPATKSEAAAAPTDQPESDFYAAFASNTDGKGTKLPELLKALLTTALKKRRALLCLDMPRPPETKVATRLDEEKAGLHRVFAYELPLEQVIDWDDDDDGGFRYVVIHRLKERAAPPGRRTNTIVEEFKVWEKIEPDEPEDSALDLQPDADRTDAVVRWDLYRVEYKAGSPPKETDIVDLVDGGTVSFKRIPILQLDMPAGLWVGNKVALPQLEHYQSRSALKSAEQRSLVVIPYVKLGPEIGGFGQASPSEAQSNPARGSNAVDAFERAGAAVLGKDDSIEFAEPEGRSYIVINDQLNELKDEMFRVVHQMALSVANNTKNVSRSGESKKEDRVAEGIVLGALGRLVRDFAVLAYDTIAKARAERGVAWSAHGLDDYESEDREQLLEEATSLDDVPIPSVTFKQHHKVAIAERLCPNMAPETKLKMRAEIIAGTTAEESMRVELKDETHDATIEGLKGGASDDESGGERMGKPAPGAPKRPAPARPGGGRPPPPKKGASGRQAPAQR